MKRISVVVLALALASPLPCQTLTATGLLEALPSGSCAAEATHTMRCGNVLLQSATIDLSSFGNKIVTVSGTLVAVPGCPELVIDVDMVQGATGTITTFSFQNFSVGTTFSLFTLAPLGSVVIHLCSVETLPLPLPLGPIGTLFLNPLSTQQWAFGLGIGLPFPRFLSIPNNPQLIGCNPNFQAVMVDPANLLGSELTNNACFVITQ